ncbi:CRISPR-associated helicase Cas3' [Streptomyces xiamenensis]
MDRRDVVPVDCRFWGKQKGLKRPYPVVGHLLDTGAVFGVLWDVVLGSRMRRRIAGALGLSTSEAGSVLSFWAALHDIGKISPPFQAQVPEAFGPIRNDPTYLFAPGADGLKQFRHEMATHWALAGLFAEAGYPSSSQMRRAVSHQIAQLLGGHHGRYGAVLKAKELAAGSAYQRGLGEEGWARQRRAHFDEVRRVIGAAAVPQSGLPPELAVVVSGLVVVADWLASSTAHVEAMQPPAAWRGTPAELDDHWRRAQESAPDWVRNARLGRAAFAAERFTDMFPFHPNALQRDIEKHLPRHVAERGPGLVLVTAPTGDGKTEAALFAASVLGRAADARGLYFALPTMATADAMFPRVANFADKSLTGERALTLLHSMAWLSPVYTAAENADRETEEVEVSSDSATVVEAGAWLRGAKRPLLASLGTGTIDQVLGAVLPVKHNALRLFGLADKVFVLDEAHAYGPWMHKLLLRLLEWLGALRAPVVLLSATLTGKTAASLVDAYRRGAGFVEPSAVEPRYPGWVFADVGTGEVIEPRGTGTERPRTLDLSLRPVFWDTREEPASPVRAGSRRQALKEALRPLVSEGSGTALVCCTTVAEAQATYRYLCEAFPELVRHDGGLRLLHSRYPGVERQRITADCEAAYGKSAQPADELSPRPASVLVATAIVEQSLDLDFDLVISDLAPLAQLLQRAGRGRRHHRGQRGRPAWAMPENRPQLMVLEPAGAERVMSIPPGMAAVYDEGLLRRTALLLREHEQHGIEVPGNVQHLIDAVYAEDFVDGLDAATARELRELDVERMAEQSAEEHLAEMVSICGPADVRGNLYELSRRDVGVTEELLTTRLGADTGRVLCLYQQANSDLTLDAAGTLHLRPGGSQGPTSKHLTQIISHTVPVPGRWLTGADEGFIRPHGWQNKPLLRDVTVLRMRREEEGVWCCEHGERTIQSSYVGLELVAESS